MFISHQNKSESETETSPLLQNPASSIHELHFQKQTNNRLSHTTYTISNVTYRLHNRTDSISSLFASSMFLHFLVSRAYAFLHHQVLIDFGHGRFAKKARVWMLLLLFGVKWRLVLVLSFLYELQCCFGCV